MIQIREMQVRDTDAVAEIERQIFSQPWSRQGFLDAVNLGNTVFLVAEENNSIIGYIGMYLAMDDTPIQLVFQSIEGLREAIPNHKGDWYFTGHYPTPGGTKLCNQSFVNYIENVYHK